MDSFFFSSRRRHTRLQGDWSSDVCSSDLAERRVSSAKTTSAPRITSSARRDMSLRFPIGVLTRYRAGGIKSYRLSAISYRLRSEERRVGEGGDTRGAEVVLVWTPVNAERG